MKMWVSKNSEVPVHEQLVAQITLGIASSDLKAGERLPSTRELARRFHVHQNTVSSAYRELAAKGLVRFKKGSGVYVSETSNSAQAQTLDALFTRFLDNARQRGYSRDEIHGLLRKTLGGKTTKRFLVIESDPALRDIIVAEIKNKTGLQTDGTSLEEISIAHIEPGTQLVAMIDEKSKLQNFLHADRGCFYCNANSVPSSMAGEARPLEDDLIAIVSGWDKFISFAKLYLVAAKVDPRTVIERSTATRG